MSTYVIADIHGCFRTFIKLLDQVKFNESSDTLYILGDIVDRGAGFYDLYQWVRERYKKSVFLTMGNHEFGFMEDLFSERFLRDSFVDSYGHFWYLRDYLNLKRSSIKQMAKFFS